MGKNNLLHNQTLRTVALMLASLFCSLMFWIYVTESEGDEIDRSFSGVQVVFEGESVLRENRGLIITEVGTTSARVTLSGNRRVVSALTSGDLSVVINLSNITRAGSYSLAPRVSYSTQTDTSAISSTTTNPAAISFYVDTLDRKTVEVEGIFNGSAADGFVAEPLEITPGSVIIYGPETVLATVDHALVTVDRTDVDRTLTFDSTYVLVDTDGNVLESEDITFDVETVSVTLPISAVKEVSLVIDLVEGGGATEKNVKWSLEPDSLTLMGDSETLSGVNSISVAKIDLSTIADETYTETYKVVIPNDTEITSGSSETTLTLEIGGLYKQTFTIDKSNITCTNVSDGYTAEVMNDTLEGVVIRGAQDAVESLSELNIRAVADLTDYGTATGIVSVPVKIYIDGNSEVDAVGEYRVYVSITES
ncbi:MAG: hypothetical protein LUF91_04345 [Oscillospiraceae bacterium]|nr:hypothetical protein [Oscillospiraceae bacterium]